MNVFSIIFPLIAVTGLGYSCARWRYLSRAQIDGLSKLTFNLLMPAFLFVTMCTTPISQLFDGKVLGAFYLPVISLYLLSLTYHYVLSRQQPRHLTSAAVFAMGSTYSNVVLLGLPVVFTALGEALVGHVFMILSLHSILMIGFTNLCHSFSHSNVAEITSENSHKLSSLFNFINKLMKLFKNPILASIVGGMLFNLAGFSLPPVVADSLRLIGKPGITCALLVLGSSLHYYSVKGKVGQIATLTVLKLIMLPFCVWLSASYVFDLSNQLTALVVILSASPTGVNAYLVATGVKQHQALIASTVVITTVLCMFTMAGWLMFLL